MKNLWLLFLTAIALFTLGSCNKSSSEGIMSVVLSGSIWKCTTGEIPNHRVQTLAFFDNSTGNISDSLYYTYEYDSTTTNNIAAEVRTEAFTYTHTVNAGTIYRSSGTQSYVCLNDNTLSTNGSVFHRLN